MSSSVAGPPKRSPPAAGTRRTLDAAHLDGLERESEVQSQMRIAGERAKDPLKFADAVAQRVVVEVEYARCFRNVEVRIEQNLERPAQISGLAIVSFSQGPERLADEGPQLPAIRYQRQEAVHA